jgi:hypothetical protein
VLLALFATPHGTPLTNNMDLSADDPRLLEVEAGTANIAIVLLDAPASRLRIEGELHGFGTPTSRLTALLQVVSQPLPAVRYRIETRGWLTVSMESRRSTYRRRPSIASASRYAAATSVSAI